MLKYILKRALWTLVVLFGVTLITYFALRLMPTDFIDKKYAAQLQNGTITLAELARIKEFFGLNDNSFFGIIKGYFRWAGKALSGDLGESLQYRQPVASVLASKMWVSFGVAIVAFVLQMCIGIPLGVTSATHQYGRRDYVITIVTMVMISLPSFFIAALLVKFLSIDLGWFPSSGLVTPGKIGFAGFVSKLHHMVLPILVITCISIGGTMRMVRTNTLEVLGSDYIRTARAKGLGEGTTIYKHAFRNTLIPLVTTTVAGLLPLLFGGMIITESFFSFGGLGASSLTAMKNSDLPFSMGYVLFLSILTVLGILIADILYAVVDPRVKLIK